MTLTKGRNTALEQGARDNVIQTQGLHKRYGKFAAVRGIDLAGFPSEVFGLIEPVVF